MIGQLDIWGNMTKFKDDKIWVKQSFIEDEIIEYKDSDGNHWVREYLPIFPFQIYVFNHTRVIWNESYKKFTLTEVQITFDKVDYFMGIDPIFSDFNIHDLYTNFRQECINSVAVPSYMQSTPSIRFTDEIITLADSYIIDNVTVEKLKDGGWSDED